MNILQRSFVFILKTGDLTVPQSHDIKDLNLSSHPVSENYNVGSLFSVFYHRMIYMKIAYIVRSLLLSQTRKSGHFIWIPKE